MAKKKVAVKKKTVAGKKAAPEKKAVLDRDFMDLLKAANTPEETRDAGDKATAIDSSIVGLFETALNSIKDAKFRLAQGKDVTKEVLNAIEYLQFGISKLKAAKAG